MSSVVLGSLARNPGRPAGLGRSSVGFAAVSFGAATLAGCATAPVQTAATYASDGANGAYHVAATGVHAVYTTGDDVYSGVGAAAKQPFRDLNMMQDPIPPVLIRAERQPYDVTGLDSCQVILDKVAELDLALGPDIDNPKDRNRDKVAHDASMAAEAALDAASSAAEGFLPMRSVIKRVSGAARYDNHVKHAVLAGTVRRAFLKAVGMEHNCGWPAAPLGFQPARLITTGFPAAVQSVAVQSVVVQSAVAQSVAVQSVAAPSVASAPPDRQTTVLAMRAPAPTSVAAPATAARRLYALPDGAEPAAAPPPAGPAAPWSLSASR